MHSVAVEDYLKHLFLTEQELEDGGLVAMGRLASAVGVTPGTATSMVKALADSGLVEYKPRDGTRLTPSGQKLALHVLRRHRIVETFLVRVLGLDWSEVHEEADALEHAISDRVLERIDKLLNHPKTDPHGDPIPTAAGTIDETVHEPLSSCSSGTSVVVERVLDQDPSFLQFLDRSGLRPGERLHVASRDEMADAITVDSVDGDPVTLGIRSASKILVRAARPGRD